MSPNLKQLRYFVVVAEELSFSAAARRLFVSQQALSRIIQQLERELGVRLLDRTTRSVALTPAGEALLEAGRRSIAAVDDAFEAARRADKGELTPQVRVDVSSSGLEMGATILRRMRRDHPDIAVRQVEDGLPRGLVGLREGRLDALFGSAAACPADIPSEAVRNEPILLGMVGDHPLARLEAVPVAELAGVDLLLPSEEAAPEWIEFVERFCQEAGVRPRRWPGTTHGSVGAAEVLREGSCVVPTTAWATPPTDLVFRPLTEPKPVFTWSMMRTPEPDHRPEVGALLACVRALREELDWLTPDNS
jgi:DNA-binding transcriptional LysR family regulator